MMWAHSSGSWPLFRNADGTPMTPREFCIELAKKRFTNGSDGKVVEKLYASFFDSAAPAAIARAPLALLTRLGQLSFALPQQFITPIRLPALLFGFRLSIL